MAKIPGKNIYFETSSNTKKRYCFKWVDNVLTFLEEKPKVLILKQTKTEFQTTTIWGSGMIPHKQPTGMFIKWIQMDSNIMNSI